MDKKKKECSMCQKAGCSYKCPKCLSPYCSSGCWTSHKLCCPALREVASKDESAPVTETQPKETVKAKVESDLAILQPNEKAGLLKSKELRSLLRSKRLRDDITCIDSSKDRQAALKAMRAKNPEFGAFVDVLLNSIK